MADQVTPDKTSEQDPVLTWNSPARPFKTRSREFYRTTGVLVLLVVVILVFLAEIMFAIAWVAVFFVIYVLSKVPPENIQHKITRLGIETAGHFHKWEEMAEFWFDEKYGVKMLVVRLMWGFPSHLQLLLGEFNEKLIRQALSEIIPYREKPVKTFLDNASDWLIKKIPLEKSR